MMHATWDFCNVCDLMISYFYFSVLGSITFTGTVSDVTKKKDWWHWKMNILYIQRIFFCFSQVNSSIHVNSVGVPDNDLMATNGVIHVVKNVLYPAGEHNIHYHAFMQSPHHAECLYVTFSRWLILITDLPVGRQDLLVLLKKLIKYIQIKVVKERAHLYICYWPYIVYSVSSFVL